jgi:hypothetical protein
LTRRGDHAADRLGCAPVNFLLGEFLFHGAMWSSMLTVVNPYLAESRAEARPTVFANVITICGLHSSLISGSVRSLYRSGVMNENNQLKMGDAVVAAILAAGTLTSSDDAKTIINRYAQIHAALVKSGGVMAPGTQPY